MNVAVISNVSILFSYSFSDSRMPWFFARLNIQLTINLASIIAAYRFSQMLNARQPPPRGAIEIQRGGVIENRGGGPVENQGEGVIGNQGEELLRGQRTTLAVTNETIC